MSWGLLTHINSDFVRFRFISRMPHRGKHGASSAVWEVRLGSFSLHSCPSASHGTVMQWRRAPRRWWCWKYCPEWASLAVSTISLTIFCGSCPSSTSSIMNTCFFVAVFILFSAKQRTSTALFCATNGKLVNYIWLSEFSVLMLSTIQ